MRGKRPGGEKGVVRAAAIAGLVLIAFGAPAAAYAGDNAAIASPDDKINYSVGFQIGGDFRRQGVAFNADALAQGVRDAMASAEPRLSQKEMMLVLTDLKRKMTASERKEKQERVAADLLADKAFLAENGKKEGVVTLPSGLQYKVEREGTGRTPAPGDNVTVRYRGILVDGTEFDSTYRRGRPESMRVDAAIPGWREALLRMKEGASWRIVIPPALGYGARNPLEGRVVIVELELLSVGSNP